MAHKSSYKGSLSKAIYKLEELMHQVDSPKSLVLHWCRLFPSRWCQILVCTRVLQLRCFKMSFLQSDNNTVMIAQQSLLWAKALPAGSWVPCALRGSPADSGRKKTGVGTERKRPRICLRCCPLKLGVLSFFRTIASAPPVFCLPTFSSNSSTNFYHKESASFYLVAC